MFGFCVVVAGVVLLLPLFCDVYIYMCVRVVLYSLCSLCCVCALSTVIVVLWLFAMLLSVVLFFCGLLCFVAVVSVARLLFDVCL